MTSRAEQLLTEILEMPEETRARIAEALFTSLDARGADTFWRAEVERRANDGSTPVAWEHLRARLREAHQHAA